MSGFWKRVRKGDRISARAINALAEAVGTLKLTVGPGLKLARLAGGAHLALEETRRWVRFELSASLAAGSSAAAVVVGYSGGTYSTTSESITVFDSIGTFHGSSGDRGLAKWHKDSGRWEVWQLKC